MMRSPHIPWALGKERGGSYREFSLKKERLRNTEKRILRIIGAIALLIYGAVMCDHAVQVETRTRQTHFSSSP